jgi:hypothetical protein
MFTQALLRNDKMNAHTHRLLGGIYEMLHLSAVQVPRCNYQISETNKTKQNKLRGY